MSEEHRWLQSRLARICERLGHPAITEHAATDSDVYVADARLSIEVQRWSTAFDKRTAVRQAAGAQVLWLLTSGAQRSGVEVKSADRALFRLPAARVEVVDRLDRSRRVEPWSGTSAGKDARLRVYATVMRLDSTTMTLRTGSHDAVEFLREILEGRRRWFAAGEAGVPLQTARGATFDAGAWIRPVDVEQVRAARRRSISAHAVDSSGSPRTASRATTPCSSGPDGLLVDEKTDRPSGAAQVDPTSGAGSDGSIAGADSSGDHHPVDPSEALDHARFMAMSSGLSVMAGAAAEGSAPVWCRSADEATQVQTPLGAEAVESEGLEARARRRWWQVWQRR